MGFCVVDLVAFISAADHKRGGCELEL